MSVLSSSFKPFKPIKMSNAFELSVADTMVENNLKLKEVVGDGNCFFASLVICLAALGTKTSITALRQKFSAHLAARVDELAPFFAVAEDDQRTEYHEEDSDEGNEQGSRASREFLAAVKKIRQSRFWDNQIIDLVVGCATEVLCAHVSIFDIDQEGNITEYQHLYEPEEEKVWPTINLLRQDDNHFNAFVAVDDK